MYDERLNFSALYSKVDLYIVKKQHNVYGK
jgi:hypothetical protein